MLQGGPETRTRIQDPGAPSSHHEWKAERRSLCDPALLSAKKKK